MFIQAKPSLKQLFVIFLVVLQILLSISPVLANPYFYLAGNSYININTEQEYEIRLNTDGDDIGALQTVLTFPSDYFDYEAGGILTENTICDIFTYPNPGTTGVENKVTPYVTGGNKLVITCGMMEDGYSGSDGLVAKLKLTSSEIYHAAEFSFSQTYFSHLGSPIVPGAMLDYFVKIVDESSATPTPTADPAATLSAQAGSNITYVYPFENSEIVDISDQFSSLNDFADAAANIQTVDITTSDSDGLGFTQDALEFIDEEDNTIPPPPADMTPRPAATPYQIPEINVQEGGGGFVGQVMSVQNLRDLLLPGKTQADKTVVMINLISTIIFLIILAFVIVKMFMNRRNSKVKSKYINDLISGELSALGTKIEIVKESKGKERFQEEFKETVENILSNVEPPKEDKKDREKSKKAPPEKK